MKRTTILLLTLGLLIVQGSTVAQAQSVTDAFYIYQNDGHFDGFFVDDVKQRTENAKASMGASLEEALASEEAQKEGLPVMDWLSSATEDERFRWMDTGVLVAFLHALHVGTEYSQGSSGGWRDWIGGALEDTEIALTRDSDGSNSIDAI